VGSTNAQAHHHIIKLTNHHIKLTFLFMQCMYIAQSLKKMNYEIYRLIFITINVNHY
jgi:hypothetical protein